MNADPTAARFWTPQRRRLYAGYGLLFGLIISLSSLAGWQREHGFVINVSDSLPNWAFWIDRTRTPERGDYIFFRLEPTPLMRAHFGDRPLLFGKQVEIAVARQRHDLEAVAATKLRDDIERVGAN